jgi:hypothetical protein
MLFSKTNLEKYFHGFVKDPYPTLYSLWTSIDIIAIPILLIR